MVLEGEHDADYITSRSAGDYQKHQDRSSGSQSSLQVTPWEHLNRCVISSMFVSPQCYRRRRNAVASEGEYNAAYITSRSVSDYQKHQDRSSRPQSSLQVTLWEHVRP